MRRLNVSIFASIIQVVIAVLIIFFEIYSTQNFIQMEATTSDGSRKPAAKYLRWNLLLTALIIVCLSFPFWFPFVPVLNTVTVDLLLLLILTTHVLWIIVVVNSIRYVVKLQKATHEIHKLSRRRSSWLSSVKENIDIEVGTPVGNKVVPSDPIRQKILHVVGIMVHKEPMDLIVATISSIARQPGSKIRMVLLVGFEEKSPDVQQKKHDLQEKFCRNFRRLYVTIHPANVEGEIPGKCSNQNYATRQVIDSIRADPELNFDETMIIFTTGDSDTVFPRGYFKLLEADFLKLDNEIRLCAVWQSPLFYHLNMANSPFFVRVTGYLRTVLMMGLLIPFNINPMSIFSLSLQLYIKGGYTHPGYHMDDIIALIRWSLIVKRKCYLRPILVPTVSGPTSGRTYCDEAYEWARQIRRWTIGAAEVFHYFMIKCRRLPFITGFSWAMRFISYYVVFLCISPLFVVFAPPVAFVMLHIAGVPATGYILHDQTTFNIITCALLGVQYFWFTLVFLINHLGNCILPDGIRDETPIYRSCFHWLMSLPTVVGYSCIALGSFMEVSIRGKDVCSHKPAKKDNLAPPIITVPSEFV